MNMLRNSHFWKVWFPPHLMAVLGLSLFAGWSTLIWFLLFYTLISGLGIAVGFHRYFSHKSFETNSFWQQMMLYWGGMACQGGPIFWVALHRGLHHRFTDTERDPHSPIHGWWRAYQGYSFDAANLGVPIRAAVDFMRNPDWQWLDKDYTKILHGTWLAVFMASYITSSPSLFVGLVCAQVWAINQEALVNLLGHKSGFGSYRTYPTKDLSVNRNWLGLITFGQSLHNNHHYSAGEANFAHLSSEFDPSMLIIEAIRT